jgi:membrane protein implicated in regulation of membrane protease activity
VDGGVGNLIGVNPLSPLVKYSLARLGLFLASAAVLLIVPAPVSILPRLAVAVLVAAVLSLVLLRRLRERANADLADRARRRDQRKEHLRRAMAGEDTGDGIDRGTDRKGEDPS